MYLLTNMHITGVFYVGGVRISYISFLFNHTLLQKSIKAQELYIQFKSVIMLWRD